MFVQKDYQINVSGSQMKRAVQQSESPITDCIDR